MLPDDKRHGTNAGYIAGCRERCCKAAHARHHKNQRTRKYLARVDRLQTDGVGTRRRIQALMALGWSTRELDRMLERRPSYVYRLLTSEGDVYLTTANMIADLYERLSMTRPSADTGPGAAIIRRNVNMAARRGYLPPLAWTDIDDPDERPDLTARDEEPDAVVVDRILAGDMTLARAATNAERREVVRRWRADGRSLNELDRAAGWQSRRYLDGEREDGAA